MSSNVRSHLHCCLPAGNRGTTKREPRQLGDSRDLRLSYWLDSLFETLALDAVSASVNPLGAARHLCANALDVWVEASVCTHVRVRYGLAELRGLAAYVTD